MKSSYLFLPGLALWLLCINVNLYGQKMHASNKAFVIHKGVNVSHWLSQSEKRGAEREQYMQPKDFEIIANMGFDHVRIPVDEEQLWDSDGQRHEEAFRLLHQGIESAFANNLRVIVDLHILRSHHFNSDSKQLWTDPLAQQQFWGFWEQLSDELSKYPNHLLAYEPLNEAVADDPQDWNKLITKGIETIRKKEPARTIILGSNRWQMVYTFPQLKIPQNDTNLILSFHFYEPFIITHYQTWWSQLKSFNGQINYPGYSVDTSSYEQWPAEVRNVLREHNQYYSLDVMKEKVAIAVQVAQQYKLPLYCGEFGCYPSAPVELRQRLYRDWIAVFDYYGIAWAHWNYKNDFPLVDEQTLEPIEEIADILIGEGKTENN